MENEKWDVINGEYVHSLKTYSLLNPHTREKLADVALSSPEEMRDAITAAFEGFQKMKELPAHKRASILFKAAERFKSRKEEVAMTISLEAAKPITFARGEVDRTIETLMFSAEEAKRLEGQSIPLDAAVGGEGYAFTIRQPIGIVGAITPFKFPLNLVVHKVAPAIASGNSIIVKPAEQTPLTSLLLAEILTECGAPKGAINVVPGDGPILGKVLLEDDRVKKISFTGSPEVGKLIKSQAGLKKVTLELGSNSAMYVDKSVKNSLPQIAKQAVIGAFSYSGQVCISTQKIYVHQEVFEEFASYLVKETKNVVVGSPQEEKTLVSSLINHKSTSRILSWIEEAKQKGAEVLIGGHSIKNGVTPTVITNVTPDMSIFCQEVFGPLVVVQPVSDSHEALMLMNNSRFGLNAGIFTNDLKQALNLAKEMEVGQVLINDLPTLRFDHMPYGGLKDSGYGREGIKYAIEAMTEMKMISINYL